MPSISRTSLTASASCARVSQLIDLKQGSGVVQSCSSSDKADCVIAMRDSDYVMLMTGKMNPQSAFMKGKLKVKGNIMLAQKLNALMPAKQSSSSKASSTQQQRREDSKEAREDIKAKL